MIRNRKTTLSEAVAERLSQIRDIGATDFSHVGKARRIGYGEGYAEDREYGPRMRSGFREGFPELSGLPERDTPAKISAALARGKGKVFRRIEGAVRSEFGKTFSDPKRRPSVPAHRSLTKKCSRCGIAHGKSEHRFHGRGAFLRTHLFPYKNNPGVSMTIAQARQYVTYYTGLIQYGMELVPQERRLLTQARQVLRMARRAYNPRKRTPKSRRAIGRVIAAKSHPYQSGSIRKQQKRIKKVSRKQRSYPDRFADSNKLFGLPNGTSTRTEVRSPTRTSTHAFTRGNTTLTITGDSNTIRVPRGNPPRKPVIVYHRLLRIEAKKGPGHRCDSACRRASHSYFHDFKEGAVVYGMPDGSITIRSKTGKRLWNMF